MTNTFNPYEILGVTRKSTISDVKKRFRQLSRKHHPDLGGDPMVFDAVSKSYDLFMSGQYEVGLSGSGTVRLVHESLFNVVEKEM